MLAEFKSFLVKQNVLALALAVVVGVATNALVQSIVDGLFMPLIGLATGGLGSLKEHSIVLRSATSPEGEDIALATGAIASALLNLLVVAFVAFQFTKLIIRPPKPGTPPPTVPCRYCRQNVDPAATRCPFCTSDLAPVQEAG